MTTVQSGGQVTLPVGNTGPALSIAVQNDALPIQWRLSVGVRTQVGGAFAALGAVTTTSGGPGARVVGLAWFPGARQWQVTATQVAGPAGASVDVTLATSESGELFIPGAGLSSVPGNSTLDNAPTPIAGGTLSVLTVASLALLPDAGMELGQMAFVQTIRAVFILLDGTGMTPDPMTVVVAQSGTRQWVRLLDASAFWAAQGQWAIDYENGDDEARGDPGNPLAGHEELMRRLGRAVCTAPDGFFTLQLLNDAPAERTWLMDGHPQNLYAIKGRKTVVRRGVVSGLQTKSGRLNRVWEFTDAGQSWPATAHGIECASGAFAWIGSDLGAGKVRAHAFGTLDPVLLFVTPSSPNEGEAYDLVTFSACASTMLVVSGTVQVVDLRFHKGPYARMGAALYVTRCVLAEAEHDFLAFQDADLCQFGAVVDINPVEPSTLARSVVRGVIQTGPFTLYARDVALDFAGTVEIFRFWSLRDRARLHVSTAEPGETGGLAIFTGTPTAPGLYCAEGTNAFIATGTLFGDVSGGDGVFLERNCGLDVAGDAQRPKMTTSGANIRLGQSGDICSFDAPLPQRDAQGWHATYGKTQY